jgi:hypothetical protein
LVRDNPELSLRELATLHDNRIYCKLEIKDGKLFPKHLWECNSIQDRRGCYFFIANLERCEKRGEFLKMYNG